MTQKTEQAKVMRKRKSKRVEKRFRDAKQTAKNIELSRILKEMNKTNRIDLREGLTGEKAPINTVEETKE